MAAHDTRQVDRGFPGLSWYWQREQFMAASVLKGKKKGLGRQRKFTNKQLPA